MRREITYKPSSDFANSYAQYVRSNPQIAAKLKIFVDHKCRIPPLKLPMKMRDYPLSGKLAGFHHCHLAGDILLIYTFENDILCPVILCDHDDLHRVHKKIDKYKR